MGKRQRTFPTHHFDPDSGQAIVRAHEEEPPMLDLTQQRDGPFKPKLSRQRSPIPTPRAATRSKRKLSRRSQYILFFILPAIIAVGVLVIFPIIYTVYMSLQDWQMGGAASRFVGLANFAKMFSDARFLQAIPRTLQYSFLATLIPVLLGVFCAQIFHQEFALRGFWRGVFVLPMMLASVSIASVWQMMFHPQIGVLNYFLSVLGLPTSLWIYSPDTVLMSLVIVDTFQSTPFVMLLILGGLASLPTEPYESAMIDGASSWDMFRRITLPLLFPYIMVAVILRMIDSLKVFDHIMIMTAGGPGTSSETLNIYLFSQAFQYFNIGQACAIVIVFFCLIASLAALQVWLRERTKWDQPSK
jgi:multiple sugar transport system permease protein